MTDIPHDRGDGREDASSKSPLDGMARRLVLLREGCNALDELAAAQDRNDAVLARAVYHLRFDMPAQTANEALSLLPLVRLRTHQRDDVNSVMDRMAANHQLMAVLARQTLARLDALQLTESAGGDHRLVKTLIELAGLQRSHLAIVGAVILPIARLRLNDQDLDALRRDFAGRRSQTAFS